MATDKRDITTSPRILQIQRKRKKRNRILFMVIFILLIVFIIGLSYLSNYHKVIISNITVEGTHIIDSNDVKNKVQENLNGKYIYLFAKRNVFIYPKFKIEKDLKKNFPRIENLSVKLDGLNNLKVVIDERTGSYIYCGASVPAEYTNIGDNCFFINSDGYIFDVAPYFSGNIYFKFYVPIKDQENPLGQFVLDTENFRDIINFIDGLADLGFVPISVVLNDENNFSINLESRPDGGEPQILFKKDNDINTIFSNLSAAMNNIEFKNQIFTKYSSLLYIDLRFNNKVLYKFK
jgi:cell division septal protein FtsQ